MASYFSDRDSHLLQSDRRRVLQSPKTVWIFDTLFLCFLYHFFERRHNILSGGILAGQGATGNQLVDGLRWR